MSETKTPTVEERLANLENVMAQFHQLLYDASFKDEAFRRLTIEKDKTFYTKYLTALPAYQAFINKTRDIKRLTKISEKIKALKEWNAQKDKIFLMYVDDTDIIQAVESTGELSDKTFKELVSLPITRVAEEKLSSILEGKSSDKPN